MKYKLKESDMEDLYSEELIGFTTDHITVEGMKVGYMYREVPDFEEDSGWRFFSGTEEQSYIDDDKNVGIFTMNTIVNYDRTILPYLDMPEGTELEWSEEDQKFIDITQSDEELSEEE